MSGWDATLKRWVPMMSFDLTGEGPPWEKEKYKDRARRTMHIHRSWPGSPWAQDRCICLPGQARGACAPTLGPG